MLVAHAAGLGILELVAHSALSLFQIPGLRVRAVVKAPSSEMEEEAEEEVEEEREEEELPSELCREKGLWLESKERPESESDFSS